MCSPIIELLANVWAPIGGLIVSFLWYADSRDLNVPKLSEEVFPEARFLITLSAGVPAVISGLCGRGIL